MGIIRRLTAGEIATLATVVVVAGLLVAFGQGMFSPGALKAESKEKASLGGASSHAEITRCAACHAPPWSRETMADRCLSCHTNVQKQLEAKGPLHGRFSNGMQCRSCHTEHKGAHAQLTSWDNFDHGCTAFELTGKHKAVDCKACHKDNVYKGTAKTCVGCHAEPAVHKGRFGTNCKECHSTLTWQKAKFEHQFPINHGSRRSRTNTCATCHTKVTESASLADYKTYSCYGCHAHQPDKMERKHARRRITDLSKCASCHQLGRKRRGRDGRREQRFSQAVGNPKLREVDKDRLLRLLTDFVAFEKVAGAAKLPLLVGDGPGKRAALFERSAGAGQAKDAREVFPIALHRPGEGAHHLWRELQFR